MPEDLPDDVSSMFHSPSPFVSAPSVAESSIDANARAMDAAVRAGDVKAVTRLLDETKGRIARPLHLARGESTPLMTALWSGQNEVARLLLPRSDLSQRSSHGETPLMIAAQALNLEMLAELLPLSDANARQGRGNGSSDGVTALAAAVAAHANTAEERSRQIDCVKALLASSDASLPSGGLTPLMIAASCKRADLLEALLPASDANARATEAGGFGPMTALGFAAENGAADCVRLLAPKSRPSAMEANGRHAMAAAAELGDHETLAALLEAKTADGAPWCSLDPVDGEAARASIGPGAARAVGAGSLKAIECAVVRGHAECVKLLLTHVDARAPTHDGSTLLIKALRIPSVSQEIVNALLPRSDGKAQDKLSKRTALMEAIIRPGEHRLERVRALLPISDIHHGQDIDTAIGYASRAPATAGGASSGGLDFKNERDAHSIFSDLLAAAEATPRPQTHRDSYLLEAALLVGEPNLGAISRLADAAARREPAGMLEDANLIRGATLRQGDQRSLVAALDLIAARLPDGPQAATFQSEIHAAYCDRYPMPETRAQVENRELREVLAGAALGQCAQSATAPSRRAPPDERQPQAAAPERAAFEPDAQAGSSSFGAKSPRARTSGRRL